MTAFVDSRRVESQGMALLLPFLRERAHDGQLIVTSKGALARAVQETIGDVIFNSDSERFYSVEVKIEARHTGNFFIEVFSNRNLDDRRSNAERGINPGWIFKLRSDLLFYYFVDTDDLYIMPLFRLQRWAFGSDDILGRIWRYPQKRQYKYTQLNDTWGWIVPIADIPTDICKRMNVRQIPIFADAAGCAAPPPKPAQEGLGL